MAQGVVLIVDDDPINVDIISEGLADDGYELVTAADGAEALAMLEEMPDRFDVVLLDRMMPRMDGMEVLSRMKVHPQLRGLPVIMQTAAAMSNQIEEGLSAGVYYYLTKPFENRKLRSLVHAAMNERQHLRRLRAALRDGRDPLPESETLELSYRTIEEAHALAARLASVFPNPDRVLFGLAELLVNAVEHGVLRIGYETKTDLNNTGSWIQEIKRRESLPENQHRYVSVELRRFPDRVTVTIDDHGDGFDWTPYMVMHSERVFENHGRGIAMARLLSFDDMQFEGNGSRVRAEVHIRHRAQDGTSPGEFN